MQSHSPLTPLGFILAEILSYLYNIMLVTIYIHICTFYYLKYRIEISCKFAIFIMFIISISPWHTQHAEKDKKLFVQFFKDSAMQMCKWMWDTDFGNSFIHSQTFIESLLCVRQRWISLISQSDNFSIHFVWWKMRIWLSSYSQHITHTHTHIHTSPHILKIVI